MKSPRCFRCYGDGVIVKRNRDKSDNITECPDCMGTGRKLGREERPQTRKVFAE